LGLSEGTDDDNIAIQDNHFRLSISQLQQHEQLKLQMTNMNSNISSLDRNVREFISTFKNPVNQQFSDSSTSSFLGLDGSTKRQRLCSPSSIISSSCIEKKDYKLELWRQQYVYQPLCCQSGATSESKNLVYKWWNPRLSVTKFSLFETTISANSGAISKPSWINTNLRQKHAIILGIRCQLQTTTSFLS